MKMTKYLSLLLGILPTAPLCAQWELNEADGYRLIVVTDRPDALYARGDEIRFIVTPVYKETGELMRDILLKLMLADLEPV